MDTIDNSSISVTGTDAIVEYLRPAEIVRAHRERLHMTQQELAHVLGLHPRTIARWEEGKFAPHEIWLRRLAMMEREATPDVGQT